MTLPLALLDALAEPVLVFDAAARLACANPAALRRLPCEPGMALADLAPSFGPALAQRLERALLDGDDRPAVAGEPVIARLGERHWALCLPAGPAAPMPAPDLDERSLDGLRALLRAAPFPAILQDEAQRLVEVNTAFERLTGRARGGLIGRDPIDLHVPEDRAALQRARRAQADGPGPVAPALPDLRLVDAGGRVHWVRAASYPARSDHGRRLWLTVLQDTTAEHAAREQAERYSRELDQWFDLSPMGMALFDERGLVLRANLAFERMTGGALVELGEAPGPVRELLRWDRHGPEPAAGAAWRVSEGALALPDGSTRWVRALLRSHEARPGRQRFMCMLEDRTAEEERDLARLQLGTLVSTAGAGLSGDAPAGGGGAAPVLTGVASLPPRELVLPASLAAFDRLQEALRDGVACEVRYAIRDGERGVRWLITRTEPGRLASGRPMRSVATVDVSEPQRAQERAEQLLAEMASILESSPAGIASSRAGVLVHCNRRFERMLRLPAGSATGADLFALLAPHRAAPGEPLDVALAREGRCETEIVVRGDDGPAHWYAVTVRRTGPDGDAPQAIAVLSEITRLKLQQGQLERLAGEHERMARAVGQQADRTRAVLDSVLVGIVTVGEQGRITWLNRSARRMFGGDLRDFHGQPLGTVATDDPEHPFLRAETLRAGLADGEAVQFECRVQARDARTFWVVGNAVATLGARGERELTVALMDIDQRREAEARIAEARASLQRIIEAAPMAITVFDASSLAVLQINRVAAALAGLSAEEARDRPIESIHPPERAARLRRDLRAALARPQAVTPREYALVHDGRAEVWDARFLPLARADGRVDQVLMVATDVTAQRAAQRAELEAAIAQREMLVQEVHHRIKNNLQGVAGLMQQTAARRPEVQAVLTEVVGQVQAIAQVYGLQVGHTGLLAVDSVVGAIAQSVRRTFGRGIGLAVHDEGGRGWRFPEAESIPIALTLNELLTNAVKHSPPGSAVDCTLVLGADGVRVEIRNDGALPEGFRIDHRPAAVSGLGLVRALLPRRHAGLAMADEGGQVVAVVTLAPPVVRADRAVRGPGPDPRT